MAYAIRSSARCYRPPEAEYTYIQESRDTLVFMIEAVFDPKTAVTCIQANGEQIHNLAAELTFLITTYFMDEAVPGPD